MNGRVQQAVFLVLAMMLSANAGLVKERGEVFSENKKFLVELAWSSTDKAGNLSVFALEGTDRRLSWRTTVAVERIWLHELWVSVSDDGSNAVLENHSPVGEKEALSFFGPKGLIRSFSAQEIVSALSVPNLKSDVAWPDNDLDLWDLWNLEGSIRFHATFNGRAVFALWCGRTDKWLSWDPVKGSLSKASQDENALWNQNTRIWALEKLSAQNRERELREQKAEETRDALFATDTSLYQHGCQEKDFVAACNFIAKRKVPEDKRWIKEMLETPLVGGGYSSGGNERDEKMIDLFLDASERNLADRLLAQWEGKWPSDRKPEPEWRTPTEDYIHLGILHGTVDLPFPPTVSDGTLWVYLFPAQLGANGWRTQLPPVRLSADLKDAVEILGYSPSGTDGRGEESSDVKPSHRVLFHIYGITPGQYRLQAVWDKQLARADSETQLTIARPGDYEGASDKTFAIEAGKTIESVLVACTNRVSVSLDAYAADEPRLREFSERSKRETNEPDGGAFSGSRRKLSDSQKFALPKDGPQPAEEWLTNNSSNAKITLRKVTFGKRHKYYSFDHETDQESLVIWFSQPGDTLSSPMLSFEAVDDRGHGYKSHGSGYSSNGARQIGFATLDAWPRRQKEFTLRVTNWGDDGSEKIIGEFKIPNLAFHDYPSWKPDGLPAIRRIDGLDVTLLRLPSPFFQPVIRVTRAEEIDLGWEPVSDYLFYDPTGNASHSLLDLRNEDVVKLRAKLFRKVRADFDATEKWIVPGVVVPDKGQHKLLSLTNTLQGVKLEILGISGMGEFTYSNLVVVGGQTEIDPAAEPLDRNVCKLRFILPGMPDGPRRKPLVFIKSTGQDYLPDMDEMIPGRRGAKPTTVISQTPHVAVKIVGLSDDHRFYFMETEEVRSDSGRVPFDDFRHKGDTYFLPLQNAEAGAAVDLSLVVQKCRIVEFFIEVPPAARNWAEGEVTGEVPQIPDLR